MDFVCPTCEKRMARELEVIIPHTEEHIINAIRKTHPNWAEKNGICKKCYDFYKSQFPSKK